MNQVLKGSIFVVLSALGFGAMGTIAKYAYASGLNVNTLLCFRFGIASIILWAVIFYLKIPKKVNPKNLVTFLLLGIFGYALMSVLLFTSFQYLPISIAVLVFYTYPFLVILLGIFLKSEKLTFNTFTSLILAFIGLLLVLQIESRISILGLLLAGMTSIVYALFIVVSKHSIGHIKPIVSSAYITSSATGALFLFGHFTHQTAYPITLSSWGLILLIAIISTAIPFIVFFEGLKLIGAGKASILSMTEPLTAVIFSVTLFHEGLHPIQYAGILLIVLSSILTNLNVEGIKKILISYR